MYDRADGIRMRVLDLIPSTERASPSVPWHTPERLPDPIVPIVGVMSIFGIARKPA